MQNPDQGATTKLLGQRHLSLSVPIPEAFISIPRAARGAQSWTQQLPKQGEAPSGGLWPYQHTNLCGSTPLLSQQKGWTQLAKAACPMLFSTEECSWEEFCKMEPSSVTPAPPSPACRTEHWGRDLNPNQEKSPHQGYKQTKIHHSFPLTKAAPHQWQPQGCHFQGRGTTPSPCPTCLSKANPRSAAASFSSG